MADVLETRDGNLSNGDELSYFQTAFLQSHSWFAFALAKSNQNHFIKRFQESSISASTHGQVLHAPCVDV